MRIDIDKITLLIRDLKALKLAEAKRQKLSDKLLNGDLTIRQRNNLNMKLETESEYIEKMHHECHRTAVDIGIADYSEDRYGEIELNGVTTNFLYVKKKPSSYE